MDSTAMGSSDLWNDSKEHMNKGPLVEAKTFIIYTSFLKSTFQSGVT